MVDSTTDVSSPQYFMSTYHCGEAQAAELSRQAGFVARTGGGGVTAEAPRVPIVASPALGSPAAAPAAAPSVLSAEREYAQLMADRTAGKITTAQWKAAGGGAERERALAEIIANGGGSQPAPAAAAPAAENHPYLGAPASSSEYGLLNGEGNLPEERVAEITAQQEAFGRMNLSRAVVQDVNARLRTATAELEHATPAQVQSRIEANYQRFGAMCAREGISTAQAEQLIGAQIREWSTKEPSVRALLTSIVTIGDPITMDYLLQISKHNSARRR